MMRLSIIVVHYKTHDHLRQCLLSVERASAGLECEVIVVDNASGGMESLTREFSNATWVFNAMNMGFGAASNLAAARSRGEVLVFLNPDAELLPDSLHELLAFFAERVDQPLGPVGGRLLFTDGSTQPSCGPFPSLGGLLWRRLLPAPRRKYYMRSPHQGELVDWVTGAYMAVKRSVFHEIGGFDTEFFLYYEDVDLCLRARRHGYAAYHCSRSVGYHHAPHAVSPRPDPAVKNAIRASRLLYFLKHRPSWEARVVERLSRMARAWVACPRRR